MSCSIFLIFRCVIVILVFVLNLVLLSISKYFSYNNSLDFGLTGVTSFGNYYSYSDYLSQCEEDHTSADICSNLSNLSTAGNYVFIFLSLDLIVLVSYSIFSIIQQISVKKIITKSINLQELTKSEKKLFVLSYRGKFIIFLHPVFVNLGLALWITKSNIEDFSGIKVQEGIIIFIIQGFASLLMIASLFWEMSAMKRRNLRKLGSKTGKSVYEAKEKDSFRTCVRV